MHYPVFIESGDETTAYGVVFPDLPGCFSAGDTLDEAMKNASEAAEIWIEYTLDNNKKVPEPSSLKTMKNNSEYKGWIIALVHVAPNAP